MAKGGLFTGNMRGKLGETVFARRNGSQISRVYIDKIKNPKSDSQMQQRVQISNVVAAYRALKYTIARGWENKLPNRTLYNEFVSANLNSVNVYLTSELANSSAFIIAPYQITKGTLQSILLEKKSGTIFETDIRVSNGYAPTVDTTVGEISDEILSNNSRFSAGDKLTMVFLSQVVNGSGAPVALVRNYAITLDGSDATLISDILPISYITVSGGNIALNAKNAEGIAAIHTRINEDRKLLSSSQSIVITSDTAPFYEYTSQESANKAKVSYRAQPNAILSPDSGNIKDSELVVTPVMTVSSVNATSGGVEQTVSPAQNGVFVWRSKNTGTNIFALYGTNLSMKKITIVLGRQDEAGGGDDELVTYPELANYGLSLQSDVPTRVAYFLEEGMTLEIKGFQDSATGEYIYRVAKEE